MDDDNALLREMVLVPTETGCPRLALDPEEQDPAMKEDSLKRRLAAYFAAIDR